MKKAPFVVPAKARGKTKVVRREVPHAWLVYREGKAWLKVPVRLDTLEVRADVAPSRAGRQTRFLARQVPIPGTEAQQRYLVQAVLDELRARRAGEAAS
jgi:hypothetical protein